MKIAIISNSHAGALKKAWEILRFDNSDIEIDFYAAAGKLMRDFKIQGREFSSENQKLLDSIRFTSGGKNSLYIDHYDIFLLYGMDAGQYIYREIFYSYDFKNYFLNKLASKSTSWSVFEQLVSATDKKIFLGHNPLLAKERKNTRDESAYVKGIALINEFVYSKFGAEMITQPTETIANGVNTAIEYSLNSEKLDVGKKVDDKFHDSSDMSHMNTDFGLLYLESFIRHIR